MTQKSADGDPYGWFRINWFARMKKPKESPETRVIRTAETVLARQKYVSAIELLCGMGILTPTHIDDWRKGRINFLERVIQGNLSKISLYMKVYRHWAITKGLKPSETGYVRHTRSGTMALQFSKSGDAGIERTYRTHYISPALSDEKKQKLKKELNQAPQPVVFQISRDAECSE
jgi:hypothetical protein